MLNVTNASTPPFQTYLQTGKIQFFCVSKCGKKSSVLGVPSLNVPAVKKSHRNGRKIFDRANLAFFHSFQSNHNIFPSRISRNSNSFLCVCLTPPIKQSSNRAIQSKIFKQSSNRAIQFTCFRSTYLSPGYPPGGWVHRQYYRDNTMDTEKDYYAILGVTRGADLSSIKRAYKKAALLHHPDKNTGREEQARAKFLEISEAYEVLADEKKRKIYDKYGESGLKGEVPLGAEQRGFNYSDADAIFRAFFGDIHGGGMMGGMDMSMDGLGMLDGFSMMNGMMASMMNSMQQDPFATGASHTTFAFTGPGGQSTFMRHTFGPGLAGESLSFGADDDFMRARNGPARSRNKRRHQSPRKVPPLEIKLPVTLENVYNGIKKRIQIKRKRVNQANNQVFEQTKIIEMIIPRGCEFGSKITFRGEGDELPGQLAGDITFVICEQPHTTFQRDGKNLIYTHMCSVKEALLGPVFCIQGLDGKSIKLDCGQEAISPEHVKVIKGGGLPFSADPNVHSGDLLISFDIRFPTQPIPASSKRKLLETPF
eukprot:g67972.t1